MDDDEIEKMDRGEKEGKEDASLFLIWEKETLPFF
jgi:hypothetical protein